MLVVKGILISVNNLINGLLLGLILNYGMIDMIISKLFI